MKKVHSEFKKYGERTFSVSGIKLLKQSNPAISDFKKQSEAILFTWTSADAVCLRQFPCSKNVP